MLKKDKPKEKQKEKSKVKPKAAQKLKSKEKPKVKPAPKQKSKKDVSYFVVLLKEKDLLYASWKIDAQVWVKRIKTAESDPKHEKHLFIDVLSLENEKYNKLDSLPVNGLENSWHIFIKKEYYGKRLIFNLSYCDRKGKLYDILISKEIFIPLSQGSLEAIYSNQNADDEKILFELAEIDLSGASGSESSSW